MKPTYIPKPGVLGTYAEYVAINQDWIALVPDNLPLEQAGGVPLVALTAWQALESAGAKAGQRILITAASGSVGHLAVQFAKSLGLFVVGTAGARNLDLVRGFGADEVVDYAGGNAALRERYGGSEDTKFDILLDLVGGETLEFAAAELLRAGGAIAHVQNAGSDAAANEKHAAVAAVGGPRWAVTLVQPSGAQLEKIAKLFAEGKARLNVVKSFPLSEVSLPHARAQILSLSCPSLLLSFSLSLSLSSFLSLSLLPALPPSSFLLFPSLPLYSIVPPFRSRTLTVFIPRPPVLPPLHFPLSKSS